MTIKEASERYNIPMEILREYESWGLCGQHRLRAVFYREFVSEPAGESTVGLEPVDDEAYSKLQ